MRKLILAVAVLALTGVTAYTAAGTLIGSTTDPTQKHQARSGGLGGIAQSGFLRGGSSEIIARGDMSGMGGGGMMGGMMGGMSGTMGKGGKS
jgi:hypothetical protein